MKKRSKHTDNTKRKMSLAHTGKKLTDKTKQKLSIANIGKKHSEDTKLKMSRSQLGKKFTDEHKHNISLARKGKKFTDEHINRMSLALRGRKLSDKTKQKMSIAKSGNTYRLGQKHTVETKKKMSIAHKGNVCRLGQKHTVETKKKMSKTWKKRLSCADERQRLSANSLKMWNDPIFKEKTLRAQAKGLLNRPTTLEKHMIDIIERNDLPYRYTGDGDVLIGYKNPDFVHTNKKICIEVANIYHHADDYAEKRIAHFKKYGWLCYVFRSDILDESKILEELEAQIT